MTNKLRNGLTNTAYTENGALSNKSTTDTVLDFFYHASARRGQNNTKLFSDAYNTDPMLATLAAFYTRDPRGGQGERATFRQVLQYLADHAPDVFTRIMVHVPTYGRWDDVLHFANHGNVGRAIIDFVAAQLDHDVESNNPSLLAKWMPSENTSSKQTVARARYLCGMLGLTVREYRKMLTDLRRKISIVETLMSAGRFSEINYERVPSRASMLYRKAFHKRDGDRYRAYLAAVEKGAAKINSGVLYPYELVQKVMHSADRTVEAQWNALPDYCNGNSFLTVCDTSGSMTSGYGSVVPITVAISLAIYSAQRNKGPFGNMWINFNSVARAYELKYKTLHQNVQDMVRNGDWGGSTNLQSVFELILSTVTRHNVAPEDMPANVVVVSDMQFNPVFMGTNFDAIKRKFANAGYTCPTITFWNVSSRVNEAPALANDKGVFLVSGCSPSIFTQVLSGKSKTPRELMEETLYSNRYAPIAETLKELF